MVHKQSAHTTQCTTSTVPNNLALINGIGPIIAARLHDNDILTFAQLAELSPEDIAKKGVGRSANRVASENWIQQAQKLAPEETSHKIDAREAASDFRQHYATFTVELLLDEDRCVRRTRVAYVQNKLEETWVGWEQSRLIKFIIQSSGVKIPPLETVVSSSQIPKTSHRENLPNSKPNDSFGGVLQAGNLETIPLDANLPQQIVHANESFNVCILLDLTEVKATPSIPLNRTVTIWAKKIGKGVRQIIGKQQSTFMLVEKIPCVVESTIPSSGIYRLEVLATLTPESISSQSSTTLRAWLESGPFQVY